jgi:hypothetical protein
MLQRPTLPRAAARSWEVCGAEAGASVFDVYLERAASEAGARASDAGFVLRVLGRAGEAPPAPKAVAVQVRSPLRCPPGGDVSIVELWHCRDL